MKKIVYINLIIIILSFTITVAEEINCTQFDKISSKYLECISNNIKNKSKKLNLQTIAGAKNLKKTLITSTTEGKKMYNISTLKEKLIKFKNSKTLTQFMEK
jgi:hypothetical protein|tara:strand:- start:110 stop:415 length:306 start_codon:yes stop_codon:yes gene_type:complete